MSTDYEMNLIDPGDWITQAEAARVRGVSRQAIAKLVKKGRLRRLTMAGRSFVHREDVENFEPGVPGRPSTRDGNDTDRRD